MKNIVLFLFMLSFFALVACGQDNSGTNNDTKNNDQTEEKAEENNVDLKNAEEIVEALKENGLSIGEVKYYNEENDPNEQLGRPGGYIAKADFILPEVEEKLIEEEKNFYLDMEMEVDEEEVKKTVKENMSQFGVENGGSIEVFDNEEDAKKRYDYVTSVVSELGGAFTEYGYIEKNIYLRLSKSILPSRADEYENALKSLVNE